jgi:hypothetical protein
MSYLRYLCFYAYSGVQRILWCGFYCFVLFVFVLCLVYPMLPVSLDCPFLIATSVFSNVYIQYNPFIVLFCLSSSCVLCTQCCQFLWIVHFWLPLRYSLTFIYNIILLLSLICLFIICFESVLLKSNFNFAFQIKYSYKDTVKPVLRGHLWDKEKVTL